MDALAIITIFKQHQSVIIERMFGNIQHKQQQHSVIIARSLAMHSMPQ